MRCSAPETECPEIHTGVRREGRMAPPIEKADRFVRETERKGHPRLPATASCYSRIPMQNVSVLASLIACVGLFACGGSQSPTETPSEAPPASEPVPAPSSASGGTRPQLTAEACEAGGGSVAFDIGDGAIHRPEYRCPSGAAPSGAIKAPEGGPVAVEGSVCCPK